MHEKPPSTNLEEKENHFKKQWANPEKLRIGEKDIEVYDIAPENKKTDVPVIIGLGWTATPESYKGNIKTYVERGRRVIAPNTPWGIETEQKENYPSAELRKMSALIKVLEEKNVEKVDAVAHSEGAIFAVMAAYFYPERFRNLVLIDPAGMIGKDSLRRLMVGFAGDAVRQIIGDLKKEKTGEEGADPLGGIKVAAENPLQAIKSVFAIANADIRKMLEEIHSKGIGISIIHGVEDRAFPMKKIQKAVNPKHVDGFYSVKGLHGAYMFEPKLYTPAVDRALDDLEKKSKIKKGE